MARIKQNTPLRGQPPTVMKTTSHQLHLKWALQLYLISPESNKGHGEQTLMRLIQENERLPMNVCSLFLLPKRTVIICHQKASHWTLGWRRITRRWHSGECLISLSSCATTKTCWGVLHGAHCLNGPAATLSLTNYWPVCQLRPNQTCAPPWHKTNITVDQCQNTINGLLTDWKGWLNLNEPFIQLAYLRS